MTAGQVIRVIDPHLHLFDLPQGRYAWLEHLGPRQKQKIARSFSLNDIELSGPLSLVGFVHIEAGFDNDRPWREIECIEALQSQHAHKDNPISLRSAGNIDLRVSPPAFKHAIDKQLVFYSCKAMRHILDEQAAEILSHEHAIENLKCLAKHNILFELQMPFTQSDAVAPLLKLLDAIPNLQLVINHAGAYPIAQADTINDEHKQAVKMWKANLSSVAKYPQVSVKCSGWEMAKTDYDIADLRPCIEHIKACFGSSRMMFASNFPLVLFAQSYQSYWEMMLELALVCDIKPEQVCYENAHRIYGF